MSEAIDRDAAQTADRIVQRERRRVRTLAFLTVALWGVAALLIPSVYLPLGAKLKQLAQLTPPAPPAQMDFSKLKPGEPVSLEYRVWVLCEIATHEWIVGAGILAVALGAGLLASVCSVALALTVRRVTLRQVSTSLAEISEQLRQLRSATS